MAVSENIFVRMRVVFIFQDIQKIYRFEYVLQLRSDARVSIAPLPCTFYTIKIKVEYITDVHRYSLM